MDALADAPDLPYVLGLQEGSVVAMADGYARATRRTSLVSLHVAAGVANGLIGMLNAMRSRTPMVVVAGQQDRRHLIQDPMLSGDLVGLASAATKHAVEVRHARDLPIVLRRAFALAARPPAGPVLVSVPMDLLEEDADVAVPPAPRWRGPARPTPGTPRRCSPAPGVPRSSRATGSGGPARSPTSSRWPSGSARPSTTSR
ncbi:thiamine pyrophosphate-binding protein [Actinomadura madurae]|uniref:thiamine pyrophosphate-binding protein n=1 Tax=Actinomadura madurae TaxID=1993 RepID=UPI0020D25536|nr:thiamine pyrophosphate-binding protein [Actinomadura madurae]MCQ0003337.1 thiamine pyrophosphate-binding protein [Actinomadura madurae]